MEYGSEWVVGIKSVSRDSLGYFSARGMYCGMAGGKDGGSGGYLSTLGQNARGPTDAMHIGMIKRQEQGLFCCLE